MIQSPYHQAGGAHDASKDTGDTPEADGRPTGAEAREVGAARRACDRLREVDARGPRERQRDRGRREARPGGVQPGRDRAVPNEGEERLMDDLVGFILWLGVVGYLFGG